MTKLYFSIFIFWLTAMFMIYPQFFMNLIDNLDNKLRQFVIWLLK